MRMKLKSPKFKFKKIDFKKYLNYKTFFIFLIFFFIVAFIYGIISFTTLNDGDKATALLKVKDHFTIPNSYDYFKLFKSDILSNTFNVFIMWILGISAIGLIVLLFLFFSEGFSVGFTISSIIYTFKYKGIGLSLVYLIPVKILYILIMFLITFFACKFSYKLIMHIFFKKEMDLNEVYKRYLKIFILSFIFIILYSFLNIFLSPFLIKTFTFLTK